MTEAKRTSPHPQKRRQGGGGFVLPRGKGRAGEGKRERGIAVLLIIACLAILAPFTASFNYQARVDWQSAVNVRDEVAARHIQRGAMQLSLLLFDIQRMVFNQKQFRDFVGTMDITQVAPYLMSVFGTEDGAEGLGAFVGLDTSSLSDLAIETGSFEFRVYAESGKINVNCLAQQQDGPDNPAGRTVETLEALMAPEIYNPLFEEEKSDGQFYTRTDVVQALADYIDDDRQRFDIIRFQSRGGAENDRYMQLADPYQPRNGRLDSIEELHLVQGIDDDWMEAFSHELTVYGQCKVNLNFASPEQVALVLRHAATEEDRWKTEGENFLLKVMPLANFIVESRAFNLFESLDQFKQLAESPDQSAAGLAATGLLGGETDNQSMPLVPDGIALAEKSDPESGQGGLADVATVAPERIYAIEVITTVGNVTKRMTAIYDTKYKRSQSQGEGAWLYIRED